MKKPEKLDINEFSYDLPDEKIARFPLEERDDSKILVHERSKIRTLCFRDLPSLLDTNHELIFNDTKVIMARLIFRKKTGAVIEIFLLEPYNPGDYARSFNSCSDTSWTCLIGNARKWKNEILTKKIYVNDKATEVNIVKIKKTGNTFVIGFKWNNHDITFSEIIAHTGLIPIPPYLKREPEDEDMERYQTIYSQYEGSVASPTAGLHFTKKILMELQSKGINTVNLTLHVGAGTFIPVKTSDAVLHEMHTEQIFIRRESIESLYNSDKKFIAVGTTSVRTLETLYWIGLKIGKRTSEKEKLYLDQWEPYEDHEFISRKDSLRNILNYMDMYKFEHINIATKIMIVPGYDFRMIDGMLTNFHLPKSTLLLLIAAFTGNDWKKIYDYALNNQYRFLSYGDSSLLLK